MHWERKNVNPMLALRTAVCNSRWQEMWQKAVLQHQRQQAQERSDRAEQRTQARRACGNPSQMSSPPQSAAASEGRASLSPSEPARPAESSSVTHPPAAPIGAVARPRSSRPSAHHRRIRGTHRDTPKSKQHFSPQTKAEASGDHCLCGTPIVQSKGSGRTKHYCSDRCRVRAHRKREQKWISSVRQQVQSSNEQTG